MLATAAKLKFGYAFVFTAIVLVVAAAVTKVVWPSNPPGVRVLGEKTTKTNTTGNGNGNGNASNPGHPITVTGQVVGALFPGSTSSMQVTIANPNNQAITVTSVTTTIGKPSKTGCNAAWFTAGQFSGSRRVEKNSSVTISLPFAFLDLPVNQDTCKSAVVPVSFSATANG